MRSILLFFLLPVFSWAQSPFQTIYGEDNRLDLYEIQNPRLEDAAKAVVALIYAPKVTPNGEHYELDLKTYEKRMGVCKDVAFSQQPSAPFATGF